MYLPSLRLDFHCCVIFTGEPTSIKLPSSNQYIYVQDVWRSARDLQSCAKSGGPWRGLIFTFNWRANSFYQSPLFYWRAHLLTLMKINRQGKSTDTQNWRGYGWNLKSNEIAKICRASAFLKSKKPSRLAYQKLVELKCNYKISSQEKLSKVFPEAHDLSFFL